MTPESVAKRHDTRNGIEFAVADLDAAEFGRKEIRLAEHEAEYIDVDVEGPFKADHCRY